jgi:predicted nucleotidyltransferase
MSSPILPDTLARLVGQLGELPGVEAIVLGGSRATGSHRPDSDWDLGLYYRAGRFDPAGVRRLVHPGAVTELGEWGPIMNGGAWLTIADTPVDVIFRDLDRVEAWLEDAGHGRFEVLTQNGYMVGAPTYLPVGELALCRPLSGEVPRPAFPDALAGVASERWRGKASVALMFATTHAEAGNVVGCVGMLAQAVLCVAHATLAQRREWALNEKRLIERAGLDEVQSIFTGPGVSAAELAETVARVAGSLGVTPLAARGP